MTARKKVTKKKVAKKKTTKKKATKRTAAASAAMAHKPTKETRALVADFAQRAATLKDMCILVGIGSENTLKKYYAAEIETGRAVFRQRLRDRMNICAFEELDFRMLKFLAYVHLGLSDKEGGDEDQPEKPSPVAEIPSMMDASKWTVEAETYAQLTHDKTQH